MLLSSFRNERPLPLPLPSAFLLSTFLIFVTFYFKVDPSKDFSVFARLSYDAYGERLSIVEEVDVKKERKFYEYILLFKEVSNATLLSSAGSDDFGNPFHGAYFEEVLICRLHTGGKKVYYAKFLPQQILIGNLFLRGHDDLFSSFFSYFRVRFPDPASYVGWVCCWFSSLLREVILRVHQFSPLLKSQFDLDYCQALYHEPLAREIAETLPVLLTLNK